MIREVFCSASENRPPLEIAGLIFVQKSTCNHAAMSVMSPRENERRV